MRLLRTLGALFVASAVVISPLMQTPTPANAVTPSKKLSVVLLGDSYSAGNGAGSYEPGQEKTSYRSTINWARNYVSWLNGQGVHTTFTNLAHSGNVTEDLLKSRGQIDQLPSNTDLVMLTIGGNDVHFSDVVTQCFSSGLRDARTCKEKIDAADAGLSGVMGQTEKIFQRLSERLAPGAQVILVGYPLLSTDRRYELADCYSSSFGICTNWVRYDAGTAVRNLGSKATQEQQKLVNGWNTSNSLKVTYIDSVAQAFAGHEPDPSALSKNDYRWVNEFFETEGRLQADGKTRGCGWCAGARDTNNWYHPNIIGHQKIALEIQSKIGVPSVTKPVEISGGDIDIVFAIDATGSMWGAIDSVKKDVRDIASQIRNKSDSYRFALVTYKDHPDSGGDPGDYPSRLELGFTTDISAFEAALANIQVGGGGDWEESVFSGIMEGLKLDWRPGVKKITLALGDAPPKSPEPITGYTAQGVAKVAFDIDPVEVYAIDNGEMISSDMQALVDLSAGKAFRASGDGEVPALITEAITTALDKPFGWLQGPITGYVGQPVTLDARGSYAFDGPVQKYEWDFDGDGEYEQVTSEGLIEHAYEAPFEGVAGVRVTAPDGQFSVGSAPVSVAVEPEPEPELQPQLDKEGVYEILDGGPLPFEVAPDANEEAALSLSSTKVKQGDSLTITGTNLPANTEAEIWLHSDPVKLATVTTDNVGGFTQPVTIPKDATVRVHKVIVKYGDTELSADLTVLKSDTDKPSDKPAATSKVNRVEDRDGKLADTGSAGATVPLLIGGAVLLLGGGSLLRARSRRNQV